MSVMIEAWLATPVDAERETQISATLARIRGRETYRELELNSICITIEFDDWKRLGMQLTQSSDSRLILRVRWNMATTAHRWIVSQTFAWKNTKV